MTYPRFAKKETLGTEVEPIKKCPKIIEGKDTVRYIEVVGFKLFGHLQEIKKLKQLKNYRLA